MNNIIETFVKLRDVSRCRLTRVI